MSEYAQRFADNSIDLSVVRDLTDQDLKDLNRRVRSRQGRSGPYAVRSEGDDVGRSIPTDVGQLARVGVVAVPTARIGSKGRELECRRCKVPASGRQRHIDTVSAEADDVAFVSCKQSRNRDA